MPTILVTGATGFVGRRLLQHVSGRRYATVAAVRAAQTPVAAAGRTVCVGEQSADTDWQGALKGVDVVMHCAARVHVMDDHVDDALAAFRHVNVNGTLNLARQAVDAGVNRFVYVSSIKVNGEHTLPGAPFTAADVPAPRGPYAVSKQEAEDGLRRIAGQTGMEVVIVRPPLVYGPRVKANFCSMMAWVDKGWPLPLGAVNNRRSFVALDSLVDLLVTCIAHPAAADRTFLVSDGEDVSISELLRRMGQALGRPARLAPVPPWCLTRMAGLLGKNDVARRLCGWLQVDMTETQEILGWRPPVAMQDALQHTAEVFQAEHASRRARASARWG